ncbi:MAG: hypothetical protein ACXWYM_00220 [Candidatus Binatia bacterium]
MGYAKLIVGGLIVVGLLALYFVAYWAGGRGCAADHAETQLDIHEENRRADNKIDQSSPDGSNKRDAIGWLRQHTRQK